MPAGEYLCGVETSVGFVWTYVEGFGSGTFCFCSSLSLSLGRTQLSFQIADKLTTSPEIFPQNESTNLCESIVA